MAVTKERSTMTPTVRKPTAGKARKPLADPPQKQVDLDDPMNDETMDDLFDEDDDERR